MARHHATTGITRIGYEPPGGYRLDVEIFKLSELRRRIIAAQLYAPHRVEFHVLLYVTEGRCTHMVDFASLPCKPGTLLALSPGQVLRFEADMSHWDGWILMFRPEFLQGQPSTTELRELESFHQLVDLPLYQTLSADQQEVVKDILDRMAADTKLQADHRAVQSLLRHQLLALIARLHLIQASSARPSGQASISLQRFKRYRLMVEQHLRRLHRVGDYAKLIGCSQKSLHRATVEVAGVSAKAYLSQRIALEAKRLLVHTVWSIAVVAEELGFDEATNFVKFFRRETGQVPGGFRREHA